MDWLEKERKCELYIEHGVADAKVVEFIIGNDGAEGINKNNRNMNENNNFYSTRIKNNENKSANGVVNESDVDQNNWYMNENDILTIKVNIITMI